MASVADVAVAIRTALEQIREADRDTAAAGRQLETTIGILAAAVEGSTRVEAIEMVAALDRAVELLTAARGQLATAVERAEQYLSDIGAHHASTAAAGPSALNDPPPASTGAPRGPGDFRSTAAQKVPVRRGTATAGILADSSGVAIHDDPLWSGSPAPTDTTLGVRNRRVARSFSNLHHVECHVAALMRAGQAPERAVLYLNNRTCRGRTPQERGCHELLPGLLRPGHQLTVHVVDADGTLQDSTVYTGTGEELTS